MLTSSRSTKAGVRIGLICSAFLQYLLSSLIVLGLLVPNSTIFAAPLAQSNENCTIYVSTTATGNGTGDSWENAFQTLQPAINTAASKYPTICPNGAEVWVAAGTYTPGTQRTNSFTLKSRVAVYGGFAGTEVEHTARNWTNNPTILSGEIGYSDTADNSYHVITDSSVNQSAVLDGFTITAGYANGASSPLYSGGGIYLTASSPTLSNLILADNYAKVTGGGMYAGGNSSPILENVTFLRNRAETTGGGGMYNTGSSPTLDDVMFEANKGYGGAGMMNSGNSSPVMTNVTFRNNAASNEGGGIYNINNSSPTLINAVFHNNTAYYGGGISNISYSSPIITNAVFSLNSARSVGGAIRNYDHSSPILTNISVSGNAANVGSAISLDLYDKPLLRNSIIWGNLVSGTGISMSYGMTISNSIIQDCGGSANWWSTCGTDGGGNLDVDPMFLNFGTGNLALSAASPAINMGSNALLPADSHDLDRDGDTTEPISDDINGNTRIMETAVDIGAYERVYVTRPSKTFYVNYDATGANNGTSWKDAFVDLQSAIEQAQAGDMVWVASGIYTPGDQRSYFFPLKNGVELYGGFSGDENHVYDRNPPYNPTYLSGYIGLEDSSDNSYHVVVATGTGVPARLDGFTITGGNANLENVHYRGGGLHNTSNPILFNVYIENNAAITGGGMFNGQPGEPLLISVNFSTNTATRDGGGMACDRSSKTDLIDVIFSENFAGANGGGMVNAYCTFSIANSVFYKNSAKALGGGLYTIGGSQLLVNTTINGNRAEQSGGGIHSYTFGDWRNLIVWGNWAQNYGAETFIVASSPRVKNSLIKECGSQNWKSYCGINQGGNLDADPLFVYAEGGNLELRRFSPVINNGGNDLLPADTADLDYDRDTTEPLPLDLYYQTRVIDGQVDMGAYEHQSPNHAPVLQGAMNLSTIEEDTTALPGMQVCTLVTGMVSDADYNQVGIAIIGKDVAAGEWQTSRNGIDWSLLGNVSESNAILLGPSAWVRFVPQADANGTARLTVRAWDQVDGVSGMTGVNIPVNGKATPYSAATAQLTQGVTPVNDMPRFSKGPNIFSTEDAGPQTITDWATDIAAGPGDESAQTLTFVVSSDRDDLFAVPPALTPEGVLTFTPSVNASGTATVTVRLKDNGGTENYGQDTSDPKTFSITITPVVDTQVSLTASPNPAIYGQAVTLIALVTGKKPGELVAPTGSVTFKDGEVTIGTAPLIVIDDPVSLSAQAVLPVTDLIAGKHSLTAVYTGDGTYTDLNTSAVLVLTVVPQTASITLGEMQRTYTGTQQIVTVTTSPASLPVRLTYNNAIEPPTNTGDYTVYAEITDPNYNGSATGVFEIQKAMLTVKAENKSRVFGAANPPLTYTISGFVNGETSQVVTSQPILSTTATSTSPVGTYPITITPGSPAAQNYTFTIVNGTLTVEKASTSLQLSASSSETSYGEPLTLTAIVAANAPGDGVPGGTVTFSNGDVALGTALLSSIASGEAEATFTTSALAAGPHEITATFNGDGNFTGSAGTTAITVTPTAELSVSILTSSNPILAGSPLTITFTAKNHGPGTAESTVLHITLPEGLNFQSVTYADDVTCSRDNANLTCQIGDMAASSTQTVTVELEVPRDALGTYATSADLDSPSIYLPGGGRPAAETIITVLPRSLVFLPQVTR